MTPWTAARQASRSITNSQSLLKLMSVESVMPSNHLILCRPLILLPSVFPSTRVFSSEPVLRIRWRKYWSFSFSISPFGEYSGLISLGLIGLISLQSKGLSRVLSNTTVQKHQFFIPQLSLCESPTLTSIHDYWKNQNGHHQKNPKTVNAGEGVGKKEPSCTVCGNVNLPFLLRTQVLSD